jgi:hypothetical protein
VGWICRREKIRRKDDPFDFSYKRCVNRQARRY